MQKFVLVFWGVSKKKKRTSIWNPWFSFGFDIFFRGASKQKHADIHMKFVVFFRIWHLFFFSDSLSRIYYFLGSYTMFKTEFNSMENKTMQNHNIFWSQIFDFLLKIRASSQKKYRQIHMILVVPLSDKKSGETRKIKHQKPKDVTCSSLWFKKITGELNWKNTKIPNDEKSKWY